MYKYICPTCGRASYSASDPAHALSDKCPYEGCDGHVKMAEPVVKKRAEIIEFRKEAKRNDKFSDKLRS